MQLELHYKQHPPSDFMKVRSVPSWGWTSTIVFLMQVLLPPAKSLLHQRNSQTLAKPLFLQQKVKERLYYSGWITCTNCYGCNLHFVDPSGYKKDNPLSLTVLLSGHLSPCVTGHPPSWLKGSADASLSNISKGYKLTEHFGRYWGIWVCGVTSFTNNKDQHSGFQGCNTRLHVEGMPRWK